MMNSLENWSDEDIVNALNAEAFDEPSGDLSSLSNEEILAMLNQPKYDASDESTLGTIGRGIIRTGSRVLETVAGMPGDAQQAAKGVARYAIGKAPGGEKALNLIDSAAETVSGNPILKGIYGTATVGSPMLNIAFPSQQDLQQVSEDLTGDYTAPQGATEEFLDEATKTFTQLIMPGPKGVRPALSRLNPTQRAVRGAARKFGQSILAEGSKELAKSLDIGEMGQEAVKLGTLFLTGVTLPALTGEANPQSYLRNIYQQRDGLIPRGTMVTPSASTTRELRNFLGELRSGIRTPEKRLVERSVADALRTLEGGQSIEMQQLLDMYRDLNRVRGDVFAADLSRRGIRNARRLYGRLGEALDGEIAQQLDAINPEALRLHRLANQGWSVLENSQKVRNFIQNNLGKTKIVPSIAKVLGIGAIGKALIPKVGLGTAVAAGATAGAINMGQIMQRVYQSPALRRYYFQVLENAARENTPAMIKSIQNLNDQYEKEFRL